MILILLHHSQWYFDIGMMQKAPATNAANHKFR